MVEITVPDLNDCVIEIEIHKRTFYLHFQWNSETEYWVMGVQNSEEEAILTGLRLVCGLDVFAMWRYLDIPQVRLFVEMKNGQSHPTRDSFAKQEAVLYYED